jgi:hypothetical protein
MERLIGIDTKPEAKEKSGTYEALSGALGSVLERSDVPQVVLTKTRV